MRVWSLVIVVSAIIVLLINIDNSVKAAVVPGLLTAWCALYVQSRITAAKLQDAHRARKVEMYREFLSIAETFILSAKNNKKYNETSIAKKMMSIKSNIILWGGTDVIKSFYEFEEASEKDSHLLGNVEKLLRAFRADIGLNNNGLEDYGLILMYLNEEARKEVRSGDVL